MNFLIPIAIGLAAGISSGVFGIGGGVIIVPLVLYIYKFSQQTCTATSLIALLLPVGSFGLWQYYRSGFVSVDNVKIGLFISIGMFAGTFVGARIATGLEGETVSKLFAIFLVLVALKIWFTQR